MSGQPCWDYMRQHVFTPAGMARTDFYARPQLLALDANHEVAHPYAAHGNGRRVDVFDTVGGLNIGLPDGAGGPHTTAPDVLAFALALQDGTRLPGKHGRAAGGAVRPLYGPCRLTRAGAHITTGRCEG